MDAQHLLADLRRALVVALQRSKKAFPFAPRRRNTRVETHAERDAPVRAQLERDHDEVGHAAGERVVRVDEREEAVRKGLRVSHERGELGHVAGLEAEALACREAALPEGATREVRVLEDLRPSERAHEGVRCVPLVGIPSSCRGR